MHWRKKPFENIAEREENAGNQHSPFPKTFSIFESHLICHAKPHSSVGSIPAWSIFFPWIDNNHCDRIHSSLTTVQCLVNGYVGKQPVAWKEIMWSICDITEILYEILYAIELKYCRKQH